MKRHFVRQIVKATLYYIIGFFITWLVYKLSGTPYAHGLNPFHLVGLLVLLGGFIWAITAIASIFTANKQIGTLLIHTIVIGGLITTFILEIRSEFELNETTNPESIITINTDSITNSSSIINEKGDTLLLKKGDTTLIDKLGVDPNKKDYR